ncbi:hypothetical protein NEIRO03_0012 [Nematocida sp. AWRm78]|nr:hypothetical protein NEIRO02_0002 [Nematocida sp. AWRm79]KAI5182328.1 hypothetical protein NEIRO03_0012 [Nematocida sp. AWRm78]
MQEAILRQIKEIKERLANLRAQRNCIPNAETEMFPFSSSLDLLRKIQNEEDYLYVEASKLKKQLILHTEECGKTSYSPEVYTMLYQDYN